MFPFDCKLSSPPWYYKESNTWEKVWWQQRALKPLIFITHCATDTWCNMTKSFLQQERIESDLFFFRSGHLAIIITWIKLSQVTYYYLILSLYHGQPWHQKLTSLLLTLTSDHWVPTRQSSGWKTYSSSSVQAVVEKDQTGGYRDTNSHGSHST